MIDAGEVGARRDLLAAWAEAHLAEAGRLRRRWWWRWRTVGRLADTHEVVGVAVALLADVASPTDQSFLLALLRVLSPGLDPLVDDDAPWPRAV